MHIISNGIDGFVRLGVTIGRNEIYIERLNQHLNISH